MKILLVTVLLLTGCTTTHPLNPKQVEGFSAYNPMCLNDCHVAKIITILEGDQVGGEGTAPPATNKPLPTNEKAPETDAPPNPVVETLK